VHLPVDADTIPSVSVQLKVLHTVAAGMGMGVSTQFPVLVSQAEVAHLFPGQSTAVAWQKADSGSLGFGITHVSTVQGLLSLQSTSTLQIG